MFWFTVKHRLYVSAIGVLMKLAPGARYQLFAGENSSEQLCRHIAQCGIGRLLLVTDKPLVELGLADSLVRQLTNAGIEVAVFDGVVPDPGFDVVEQGLDCYRQAECDAVVAFGGGSSIDAAKMIAMAATNLGDPRRYVGFSKLKVAPAPLYAIPTTSGTGSEATTGAIISDGSEERKLIIADPGLLPRAAALDPLLLVGLPRSITAATGMDALTHAIEAYIGHWDAGDSKEKAAAAVRLIFQHLPAACADGANLSARDGMAHAAYMAGQAINQVNVGNVHAIAHQLGAIYGIAHGLANAIVLPHVLDLSRPQADPKLAELASLIGREGAQGLVDAVRELNNEIGIPSCVAQLRAEDVESIARRAVKEGAGYPVPHLMSVADCTGILRNLLAEGAAPVAAEGVKSASAEAC